MINHQPRVRSLRVLTTIIAALTASVSVAAADPNISIEGECPGIITLSWKGAPPDEPATLWFGFELGPTLMTGPFCQGTVLDITNRIRLLGHRNTSPDGAGAILGRVIPRACGGYLQMMVLIDQPCITSNVVQIPE